MTPEPECMVAPSLLGCDRLSPSAGPAPWRIAGKSVWPRLAVAVLLFTAIWFIYRSSLAHAPRSDQWSFLMDTIDQDGFVEIFGRTYSYNRMREVGPGDYQLFRPCLFALLSAEKALFGNHFAAWQWSGIVLHFLAVCLALQVMLRIQRLTAPTPEAAGIQAGWFTEGFYLRVLPYALVLFWGMNFAICEIVIFSHINGYILFLVFVLAGLIPLLDYWGNPHAADWKQALLLGGGWLLLALSAFTHELGQFFAVAVGLVLAMAELARGRLRRGLALLFLFAGVLLLYQAVNVLDKRSHPGAQPDIDAAAILKKVPTTQTVEHVSRYVMYTAVQPFFPSCAAWSYVGERLNIEEPRVVSSNYRRGGPVLIISYLVIGAGLLLAVRGFYHLLRGSSGRNGLLLLLPIALFAGHLALIAFGRMNMRPGPRALGTNSYYTYVPLFALVLCLSMICTCGSSGSAARRPWLVRSLFGVFLGGLTVLTLYSGEQVSAINVALKNEQRTLHATTAWLVDFMARHRDEPDFSFALDEASYKGMNVDHGIPQMMILFKRHLNNKNPKYLVSLRGSKCSAIECDEGVRTGNAAQVFPDLAKIGTSYNFYYFDGMYYGVRGDDGYYRPDREEFQYLITDRTLEGALAQVPAKLAEQEADGKARKTARRSR